MQPEQTEPQRQPTPQPSRETAPPPRPTGVASSPAARRPRPTSVILGAAVVVALAIGAVATGLVNIPGFETATNPPQVATVTQTATQQTDEGDHTIGVRIAPLTPDYAKAHQISISRDSGVLFQEVFADSPAEQAGLRTNDVIIAIDGVPIERVQDVLTKIRFTPIGQSMSVTVERAGATQQAAVTVSRCHIREAPKGQLTPGMVTPCRAWTAN